MSGTSMAAPHITGIVAQLYQVSPSLTPAQVENVLEDTAWKSFGTGQYEADPFNADNTTSFDRGHGLVDALAAVRAL
jgi:serine protease AprX